MKQHLFNIAIVAVIAALSTVQAADRKVASSGATQVVAKVNDREITVSDLRVEMARLGLQPNTPDAEKIALNEVVNRILLHDAAKDAGLHRRPDAMRRMAAASERALADLYATTASQPPEPTVAEIEDFITGNPSVFAERKIYEFLVLTLPTTAFDGEALTPLFDETSDFAALEEKLRADRIEFQIAPAVQPSNAFPEAVRQQLSVYGPNDNIVIQGPAETQIMKIASERRAPVDGEAALAAARRALLAERTEERQAALMQSLRRKAAIAYYREDVAPRQAEKR